MQGGWKFCGDSVEIVCYRNVWKQGYREREMILAFGHFELDTELFELRGAGLPVPLEPQVFDLLAYLAMNSSRIISRQELLDNLWEGKIVSDSTLSSAVKAARRALGDDGRSQQYITTFNRRGYRFVAPLEQRALNSSAAAAAVISNSSAAMREAARSICLFTDGAVAKSERPVLAVLPFSHSQGDDAITWIADTLGEDISIQLARIPGFFVLSRNTTSHLRQGEFSIQQIAAELAVDYVIEGSVRASGGDLRVSVQLLEAAAGNMRWSERRVIPFDRVGELQDELVREIVACIEPALNRAELATLRRRKPVDLGAWALYRRAHAILGQKGWSEDSFAEAAELLRQAIDRDPELAFAHAYLALTLAIGHLVGLVSGEAWQAEAIAAAETAVALDNQDTDVLGYAGCAFADMGDLERGVGMLRRAVELDPSNAQAITALGAALLRMGDEQGIEYMKQGMKISPRDSRLSAWSALLARAMLNLGRLDEAIETATHACRCDDKIFLPRVVLAVAYISAGDPAAAGKALADARRIRPILSTEDIACFASPEELSLLEQLGWR